MLSTIWNTDAYSSHYEWGAIGIICVLVPFLWWCEETGTLLLIVCGRKLVLPPCRHWKSILWHGAEPVSPGVSGFPSFGPSGNLVSPNRERMDCSLPHGTVMAQTLVPHLPWDQHWNLCSSVSPPPPWACLLPDLRGHSILALGCKAPRHLPVTLVPPFRVETSDLGQAGWTQEEGVGSLITCAFHPDVRKLPGTHVLDLKPGRVKFSHGLLLLAVLPWENSFPSLSIGVLFCNMG